jgi:hypothetical protein
MRVPTRRGCPLTSGGALAAAATTAESATPGVCGRETARCPPTVLCNDQARRVALARERPARVRGRPRHPLVTIATGERRESGGPSTAPGAGSRARSAPGRSLTPCMQPGCARLAGAALGGPVRRQAHPPSGRAGLEQRFGGGWPVAVHPHLPSRVHTTDVHAPGVQGDATVTRMRRGVESPEVSSAS